MVYVFGQLSSHGSVKIKIMFQNHPQKQNIVPCPLHALNFLDSLKTKNIVIHADNTSDIQMVVNQSFTKGLSILK